MLYDKYFSRYEFLKIYLRKIQIELFFIFMISSRINKGVHLSLLEHANTRNHVYEHSCSSEVFFENFSSFSSALVSISNRDK